MKLIYERGQNDDEDFFERVTINGEPTDIVTLLDAVPAIVSGSMCDALLAFAENTEAATVGGSDDSGSEMVG